MQHTCLHCLKDFTDKRPHAKFCSNRCYGLNKRTLPDYQCERCGKSFRSKDENPRFCSKDCYEVSRKEIKRRPNHACEACRKSFYDSHSNAKFCSRVCFGAGTRTRQWAGCLMCGSPCPNHRKYCQAACYHQAKTAWRKERQCRHCPATFLPVKKAQQFCTRQCLHSFLRVRKLKQHTCRYCGIAFQPRKGDAIHCSIICYGLSQRGDTKRSGKNFSNTQKRKIAQRDGLHCRVCGVLENLDVDHILAICNGGDNSLENGQILCDRCHTQKTKSDRRLFASTRLRLTKCDAGQ